jgi:hypothetical protein
MSFADLRRLLWKSPIDSRFPIWSAQNRGDQATALSKRFCKHDQSSLDRSSKPIAMASRTGWCGANPSRESHTGTRAGLTTNQFLVR